MLRLRDFFDHVLKGVDNGVKSWPKVQIEVRERNGVASVRTENEWPIARTHYTKLYLNAADGRLQPEPVAQTAAVSYGAVVAELAEAERATFAMTFDRDTELTGYMKLRVFMSCAGRLRWPAQARRCRRSCPFCLLRTVRRWTASTWVAARLAPRA